MRKVEFSKAALKAFNSYDKNVKIQIKEKLDIIANSTHIPIGKLKGYKNKYKAKIQYKYRIIYTLTETTVIVNKIDSRGDIYKRR